MQEYIVTKNLNSLIILSTDIINSWPTYYNSNIKLLKMESFIRYILKKSKTSYNTFYVSLFYLSCLKNNICKNKKPLHDCISCGRRMFLISLILADKYLHDKHHNNKYWAKITKLTSNDISLYEIMFIKSIDYNLYITKDNFYKWRNKLDIKYKKINLSDELYVF